MLTYIYYSKYYIYISINKYNYKELAIVYGLLPKLYAKGQRDYTIDEFSVFFFGYYPRLKPEEVQAYLAIFEQAKASTVAEAEVEDYLILASKRQLALNVAEKAFAFSEGKDEGLEFERSYEAWELGKAAKLVESTEFVSDNLEELLDETITKSGLRWRLASLNKALGSLRTGDFGFVFARPETGKTTFLASECTFMAGQTDKPIVWFNNEEQGNKVKLRCFQAALGVTLEQLISDPARYREEYMKLTGGRIKIYDEGAIYRRDVERIIEEMNPALVVFDQIDKIKGFDADRNDLLMGAVYQWARELAKEYAPVIGICQADGTGEGVKWLTMGHVAEAKTAKQATADWILGIGRTYGGDEPENVRYFHLSKNKLAGDRDSDPELRHGKIFVWIEPEYARFRDMGD